MLDPWTWAQNGYVSARHGSPHAIRPSAAHTRAARNRRVVARRAMAEIMPPLVAAIQAEDAVRRAGLWRKARPSAGVVEAGA